MVGLVSENAAAMSPAGSSWSQMSRRISRRTGDVSAVLDMTRHPPGPLMAMMGEQVVHGEDIRRPLGIVRGYPEKSLTQVADFFKRSNLLLGGKKRTSGLTLRATDADWSSGDGPEVEGPMVSLVLMIAGRKSALDDLTGDGLAILRTRD
jgi:uncharacterized protein (TIGR03083 family)